MENFLDLIPERNVKLHSCDSIFRMGDFVEFLGEIEWKIDGLFYEEIFCHLL
jgi:hypothetical protein